MLRRRDVISAYQRARMQRPQLAAQLDSLYQSAPASGLTELVVGRDSPAAETEVRSLVLPPNTLLVAVRRGERTIIPRGDTVLEAGDRVVALAEQEHSAALRRVFARGGKEKPAAG
jgi:Trk K+ transport system NAD-binding subunit